MDKDIRPISPYPALPITQPDFQKYITCKGQSHPSLCWISWTRKCFSSLLPTVYASTTVDESPQNIDETPETPTDKPINDIPVLVTDDEVQAILAKETGRDRLKEMFSKTDAPSVLMQNVSPQLRFVKHITESAIAMGFVFGVSRGARLAAEERMTKHLTVRYPHKVTRLRRYYDAMLIKGIKQGLIYGLATGAFTCLFMLVSQSISVYRNKSSFVEYSCAGGIAAALSRLHIGPKAMISGGVLGTSLGTIGGSIIYALLKFTKETQEQQHYWAIYNRLRHEKQMVILSKS